MDLRYELNYVIAPTVIVLSCSLVAGMALRRLLRKRSGRHAGRGNRIRSGLLLLIALGAAGMAMVCAWNACVLAHFRANPPGLLYSVDGHRMRLDCTGSGAPTVVLDAGLGNDGLIWGGVQPALSRVTRVCSYDRAGFGWSDTLAGPRDADHITIELHDLLRTAQVQGPLVLMGHSIAGMYIRDFASRYPSQVAGLVFVDASTPWQNRNPAFQAIDAHATPPWYQILQRETLFASGLPRWMGECAFHVTGVEAGQAGFDPAAARRESEALCSRRPRAFAAELGVFDRSGTETMHTGPYGQLPVLIFSEDSAKEGGGGRGDAVAEAWDRMQEDLKRLSTRSRRIIARGSGHYIQLERADLVEREVTRFVEEVRGSRPDGGDFGKTTVE